MSDDRRSMNEIEELYNENKRMDDRYWISGAQLVRPIARIDWICDISEERGPIRYADDADRILSHIKTNQFLGQKTEGLLAYIEANQFENEEDPTTEG